MNIVDGSSSWTSVSKHLDKIRDDWVNSLPAMRAIIAIMKKEARRYCREQQTAAAPRTEIRTRTLTA